MKLYKIIVAFLITSSIFPVYALSSDQMMTKKKKYTTSRFKIIEKESVYFGKKNDPSNRFDVLLVSQDGLQYEILSKGDSKNKKMIFLHGFPENAFAWREQMNAFENDYHVMAINLKGYGRSSKSNRVDDFRIEKIALEISNMLESLSDGKDIVLVGHDWGGTIGWKIAMNAPSWLRAYVAINSVHPILWARNATIDEDQIERLQFFRNIQNGIDNAETFRMNEFFHLRNLFFENSLNIENYYFDEVKKMVYLTWWKIPDALESQTMYYKAVEFNLSPWLFKIPVHLNPFFYRYRVDKVPVLTIYGENDIFQGPNGNDGLEFMVKNLTQLFYPNNSHWILHEEPIEISRQIRKFLKTLNN